MSRVKLQRSLEQWDKCDPKTMASEQSTAAIQFAIADAKRDISALSTANQRLEQEISKLKTVMANQSARQFVGHDDQRHIDDLVAAGIRASDAERLRLEGDVARLREALELWLTGYDEVAASPNFEPFPHVAERVAKTRAALRGNGVSECLK
jgi:hypothetical protein